MKAPAYGWAGLYLTQYSGAAHGLALSRFHRGGCRIIPW